MVSIFSKCLHRWLLSSVDEFIDGFLSLVDELSIRVNQWLLSLVDEFISRPSCYLQ